MLNQLATEAYNLWSPLPPLCYNSLQNIVVYLMFLLSTCLKGEDVLTDFI